MSDERRERYATEIYRRVACYPWDDISDHEKQHWYPYVDAAMSVADAELNEELVAWAKDARKLLDKNARLREELRTEEQVSLALSRELEATRRAKQENDERHQILIADLRKEHEVWGALARRNLERAHEENARLREERDEAREQCTEMGRQHRFAEEEAQGRIEHLRAIIERVRVLVDSIRPASKAEVLAALGGESTS